MTTGAPPDNVSFMSTKRIMPSVSVQTKLYNEAGFIPHPLQHFGQAASGSNPAAGAPRNPAGNTGNIPGGFAWQAGHPHTINGREPGSNY